MNRLAVIVGSLFLGSCCLWGPRVLASEDVEQLSIAEKIQYARDNYDFGLYDTALAALADLPPPSALTADQVEDVLVLEAACQVRLGLEEEALQTCCLLRSRLPMWTPGTEGIEVVIRPAFEKSITNCRPEEGGTPWGWIIGGGAAVVGAALALILSGGEDGSGPTPSAGVGDYPAPPGGP
jgi:hypothetical protein